MKTQHFSKLQDGSTSDKNIRKQLSLEGGMNSEVKEMFSVLLCDMDIYHSQDTLN